MRSVAAENVLSEYISTQKRNVVNYREEEKKILDRIINREVYDTRMRPKGFNKTSECLGNMIDF